MDGAHIQASDLTCLKAFVICDEAAACISSKFNIFILLSLCYCASLCAAVLRLRLGPDV